MTELSVKSKFELQDSQKLAHTNIDVGDCVLLVGRGLCMITKSTDATHASKPYLHTYSLILLDTGKNVEVENNPHKGTFIEFLVGIDHGLADRDIKVHHVPKVQVVWDLG